MINKRGTGGKSERLPGKFNFIISARKVACLKKPQETNKQTNLCTGIWLMLYSGFDTMS